MESKLTAPPAIFNVNWFRTDDEGHFLWPGFGDNLRVLDWVLARCEGKVTAAETALGFVPKAEDLNLEGAGVDRATVEGLLQADPALWRAECEGIRSFYAQVGEKLPAELAASREDLEAQLGKANA
jgi:phosphoenolpyruvate carboxykinase (GTP)